MFLQNREILGLSLSETNGVFLEGVVHYAKYSFYG